MNKMKSKLLFLLAVVVVSNLFIAVASVTAQQNTPTDDQVNAIAKKLYCPVCPNTPLDVCETKACQDWRAQIRDQLAAGWSEDKIINYFVAQYGERVLAEPQRRGFSSLVWVLPVVAALLGVVIVWQVLRSWKSRHPEPLPARSVPQEVSPEAIAHIEKELKEME
jgi:cytochrome c-type biogenesis protein CcmH